MPWKWKWKYYMGPVYFGGPEMEMEMIFQCQAAHKHRRNDFHFHFHFQKHYTVCHGNGNGNPIWDHFCSCAVISGQIPLNSTHTRLCILRKQARLSRNGRLATGFAGRISNLVFQRVVSNSFR